MTSVTFSSHFPQSELPIPRLGYQRDWYWRGRRVRYTFLRPREVTVAAPPILLIHGFGAALGHWRYNLEALSQHHPVYALDLLGFGNSEKAHAPYSPLFWAEQVHDFWQTFIDQPTILVGNSLGSVTAMMVAARYPAMVQALAWINLPDSSVLGPDLSLGGQRLRRLFFQLLSPLTRPLRYVFTSPLVINPLLIAIRRRQILTFWAKKAYRNPTVVDPELMDILGLPPYHRGSRQALRAMTRFVGNVPAPYRARSVLPQLTVPMLLIWGKQDLLVPPLLAPKLAALNPRIRWVELEDAGHCPHDECPEQVNGLLLDWLNQLGERSADVHHQDSSQNPSNLPGALP